MFSRPTSRLFVIKFLGLWGTTQTQPSSKKEELEIKRHDALGKAKESHESDGPCHDPLDYKQTIDFSSKRIIGLMLEKGIPGLTICVSKKGKTIWHSAFGYCDVENQLECRPEARMRIASVSKPVFAATVVGPLLDDEKLDLNTSTRKYLSENEFPRQKYDGKEVDITIKQLLSHTSGIKHYDTSSGNDKPLRPIGSKDSLKVYQSDDQFSRQGYFQRRTFRSVLEALEPFKDGPLVSEPGTSYKYSSYGYTLLSAVVEKVYEELNGDKKDKNGQFQIEDFWMKVLRRDWKLNETSLDQDEPILANRAKYYLRTAKNGNLINAPYTDNSIKWAGGGLVSTTHDMVLFGNALIDSYKGRSNARLKRDTINQLWEEVARIGTHSYGLGFGLYKLDSRSGIERVAVHHTGCALGASSVLLIYPENEIVVAILSNLGEVDLRPLGLFVADNFV